MKSYAQVFSAVLEHCAATDYRGYDPYDGCNTDYEVLLRFNISRLTLKYLHKFSPVNLRPLFKVRRSENIYARALITSALLRTSADPATMQLARNHVQFIIGRSLIDHVGHHSWNGNGIPIQGIAGLNSALTPGVVGTEAIVEALLAYYAVAPEDGYLRAVLTSARDFCLEILLTETNGRSFFRYTPEKPLHVCTFNASMRGAMLVGSVNRALGTTEGDDAVRRCYEFLLSYQQNDGSWFYSIDFRTGVQKRQIDYHQGFMLDGLLAYLECYGEDTNVQKAFDQGLHFYRTKQFLPSGQSLYRYPRRWPTNIINQAQGIATFSRAGLLDSANARFAERIADWTLANMYDASGYFHFLKYPGFNNRISYLRWNQAWMLYALSFLINGDQRSGEAYHATPAVSVPRAPRQA